MKPEELRRLEAGAMYEAELLDHVRRMCRDLDLAIYHTFRSDRSEKGYPDCTILGTKLLFRELKRETGKPTAHQRAWLDALKGAGYDAGIWRPSQLLDGTIMSELLAVRCG